MPNLSTVTAPAPAARAIRANTASQASAGTSSAAPSASSFLGQLKQSLTGQNASVADSGSAAPAPVDPAKPDGSLVTPQLAGQPSLTSPPTGAVIPVASGKAGASPQAVPVAAINKKSGGQDGSSAADQPPDATDTSQPLDPVPPPATPTTPTTASLPTLMLAAAQGSQQPVKTGAEPSAAETASTPGVAGANVDGGRSKLGAHPAAPPASATAASAQDQSTPNPPPNPMTQVATAPNASSAGSAPALPDGDPAPTGRSITSDGTAQPGAPELRRTKLAADGAATATSTAPTQPVDLPASAAPAPTITPTPQVAASPLLQVATSSTSQPSSANQASQPTAAPSPAVQVAQAVAEPIRIVLATPPQQAGGPHVTTIQLDPVELGRVEIRIERTGDGPAKVELAAERPETLLRLVHDQPQLQQALDQAGIPQSGRTITFSLASDNSAANSTFANSAGDGASNGSGQRSQQSYGNPQDPTADSSDTLASTPAWTRTGLDITA